MQLKLELHCQESIHIFSTSPRNIVKNCVIVLTEEANRSIVERLNL